MKTGGLQVHLPHPQFALHMPHPAHWLQAHQKVTYLLAAGLAVMFFAVMVFLAYRLGGSSGSAALLHTQPTYYPFYW